MKYTEIRIAFAAIFVCNALFCFVSGALAAMPHIVVILADDLGWGDPQCYQADSKIPTPHIDRLAQEGFRFTNAHTPSSVCTPTRYGLLTGRYCWRTELKRGVLDGFDPPLLTSDDETIASLCRRAGYFTACVGKWHLGMNWFNRDGSAVGERGPQRFRPGDEVDFERDVTEGPLDVGFDHYFGISASLDMSPYAYLRGRRVETLPTERHEEVQDTLFLNGVPGVKSPGFDVHDVLTRLGDEAVSLITRKDQTQPLFLYMPLNSPHLPVAPTSIASGKSQAGSYGDFVWETDHVIGRVLNALDTAGMSENTLFVVTSDNGGLWHWWDFSADDDGGKASLTPRGDYVKQFGHQSNAGWRGTKADIYEGGHRVPFLVRWPDKVAGGKVTDALVELTDLYATVSEITEQKTTRGKSGMDSFSLLPLLTGQSDSVRPFAVHHSHNGMFALRVNDWKMIEGRGSGGFTTPRTIPVKKDDAKGQLYHLSDDAREQHNLWLKHPDRIKTMAALLDRIRNTSARSAAETFEQSNKPLLP